MRALVEPHAPTAECSGCRELFGLDVAAEAVKLEGRWAEGFGIWSRMVASVWHGVRKGKGKRGRRARGR